MKFNLSLTVGAIFLSISALASDETCTIRKIGSSIGTSKMFVQPMTAKKFDESNSQVIIDWKKHFDRANSNKINVLEFADLVNKKIDDLSSKNICTKLPLKCRLNFLSKTSGYVLAYGFDTIDPLSASHSPLITWAAAQGRNDFNHGLPETVSFEEGKISSFLFRRLEDVAKEFPINNFKNVLAGLDRMENAGTCIKRTLSPCTYRFDGWLDEGNTSLVITSDFFDEIIFKLNQGYWQNSAIRDAIGQKLIEVGLCSSNITY